LRDEVGALERDFDADLGPEARRWAYFHILPRRDLGRDYNCAGVPAWERRAFPLLLGPMSGYIRHLFAIGPETDEEAGAAVRRTFDAVAARLADGRRYLCGDAYHRRRPRLRRPGRPGSRPAAVRRAAAPARRAPTRHGRGRARVPRPSGGCLRVPAVRRGALIRSRRRPAA
jgi:glutathione S-transferase